MTPHPAATPPRPGPETDATHAFETLVRGALGARLVRVEPLAPGLGARRFWRLHLVGGAVPRAIAREEPGAEARGGEPPLEPLRGFLEAHGLPVPGRLGSDPARGIELLEDLGPTSLEQAARELGAEPRRALYAEACAIVARLQRLEDPDGTLPAFRRRLDRALIETKAALFVRFSLRHALGRAAREREARVVHDAFAWVAEALEAAPQRLAHRDFQSSNLFVRGGGGLAMIDFQGAFLAPPEYDLVCLLRDSYVVLPDAEVRGQLAAVRDALPDRPAPGTLAQRFDLLTLVRKGKDHARFLEAALTRGDRRRLSHLGPTLSYLRDAAARSAPLDPRLARFAALVDDFPEEAQTCAP